MTKKIYKTLFFLYQGVTRSQNATCRYSPTCSQYALDALNKYGLIKGTLKSALRVLNCHPFSTRPMYDPA